MHLVDITFASTRNYDKAREFSLGANCVSNLYKKPLGKIQTGDVQKVAIEASESVSDGFKYEQLLDVVCVQVDFDFDSYWDASTQRRKRMILDCIHATMCKLCEIFDWEIAAFASAYESALKQEIKNVFVSSRHVKSPDRKHKACWCYEYEPDGINYYVILLSAEGDEVNRHLVHTAAPLDSWLQTNLNVSWRNDTRVALSPKGGRDAWECDFA